jgi:hypothetical protein
MQHDELIARAREHMKPFERLPSDAPPLHEFSTVRLRETVLVYFTRPGADDRFEICLDRDTGECVGATYTPPTALEGGGNG